MVSIPVQATFYGRERTEKNRQKPFLSGRVVRQTTSCPADNDRFLVRPDKKGPTKDVVVLAGPDNFSNMEELDPIMLARAWELLAEDDEAEDATDDETGEAAPRTRQSKPRPDYKQSLWWRLYIEETDCRRPESREHAVFRRRFGVSFALFRDFVNTARGWGIFKETPDAVGRPPVPLELKILGALRMVAKGCCFDAIAELSSMGGSTMQQFFHKFWERFVQHYKSTVIKYPRTAEEASEILEDFRLAGFPGAVGSVDVTHVHWLRCPAGLQNLYTGKEGYPSVAYEVVVTHRRKIIHVGCGFPGSCNDKEIVKSDTYVQAVKKKEILYNDVIFSLKTSQGVARNFTGGYFITDNGYAKWRIMQAPLKHCRNYDEAKWSERIESLRKDIECTFGVLKRRFQILASKIEFQFQEYVDNLFYAACIMHNLLLAADGLDGDFEYQETDDDDIREAMEEWRIQRNGGSVPRVPAPRREQPAVDYNEDEDLEDSHLALRDALIDHYMTTRPGWTVRAGR